MTVRIILASQSEIRRSLLETARIDCGVQPARVDEDSIKSSLMAENAPPRDIADALAEMKALKVSERTPGALVIGCDQVLTFEGRLLSKPASPEDARAQLAELRGKGHRLISAAVICEAGKPIWRHVGVVQMQMREVSDGYLDTYVARNWDSIRQSVGAYKLEEEGVRLFSRITGDHFHVLGLPLLELIGFLAARGDIDT